MANQDTAQAAFDNCLQLWTTGTTAGRRAPVLRRPDEVGLDYQDVFFPSMDGVSLEGWFIPAESDRLQPVSGRYIVEEFVKSIGMADGYRKFDDAVHQRTGFHLAEQSPLEHVRAVAVPTLVAQVHDDTMTRPQDVQDIYDAIPVAEKRLYWIEGTERRFDGYNFFGVHPEVPIEWFDKHVN
ncbi:hypothetical protein I546_5467 [Mycobacterium kansasii 732]|uniref:Uncharacterized protein n=1 Tax=Mycobacterium pseudokansasii TaxID=2341080 RepID=A0A498QV82_9MYCO|nr:alpha/beta hydrolase [Mycobacterium pseudokansasii]EUA06525.1 hypothetical protein I546_5467 [Mycobacterium kansasii 732]MBY0391397.1 alpha/beta hydrolase [Mycobacterium pseudokansasii]VAZ95975.1 hypothetical protein LAUMK35_03182 [Mycobacterium pseudokansasii]VAZ97303.1 hypothetical protein LAUMK21_03181 [Mycobacterium pseudokansasii]VBA51422.1 hypothetical protein LAUMK142_03094 [Mycobacterium pseudokansasii]